MKQLEVRLSGASIRNGRVYFDRKDSEFFPSDSFGDRDSKGGRGNPVEFHAGPEVLRSDIRYLSETRIGPRSSFAGFLKGARAREGDSLRVTLVKDRTYRVDCLGSGSAASGEPVPLPTKTPAKSTPASPARARLARGKNSEPTSRPPHCRAALFAGAIFAAATPVIRISALGGKRWKRNVAKGARIGPWLQANYELLDESAWRARGACLYMVAGIDRIIRYVGISRNGLKHRWRTSPAFDADTMQRLPRDQLFHSQCWKHIEAESGSVGKAAFEVRSIAPRVLAGVLEKLGPPLSAFCALGDDGEGLVASLERWICNNRSDSLARWNVAMTA